MREDMWQPEGARVLYQEHGDEERSVACWEDEDASLHVSEVTSGVVTQQVFDAQRHAHAVVVTRSWRGGLAQGLEVPAGDEVKGLERLLGSGEVFLSDLMDLLDARDTPYAYASQLDDGPISWRPAGAWAVGPEGDWRGGAST